MPYIQITLRLLALLLAGVGNAAVARDADSSPVPPIPTITQAYLPGKQPLIAGPNGEALWITTDRDSRKLVKRIWLPTTGAYSDTPLNIEGDTPVAQVTTPSGILFLTITLYNRRTGQFLGADDMPRCCAAHIFLVRPNGNVVRASLQQQFIQPRLILLSDGSVAVLERDEKTRHIRIDLVRLRSGDIPIVEQMPELAVPTRNDYSEAPLPDGRLMVLGGSDAPYRGCSPCRAETHVLDPKGRTWEAGPSMLEPRSEHLATSLPDGSILVTGGWTPTHGWGHGPSRTAELWNPVTNKFEAAAPMPSGTSRHRAVWMPGQQGKTLLIAGGTNSSIHVYDLRSGEWRTAGATWQGSEEGGCVFVPFVLEANVYAWTANKAEGHYSSKSCAWQEEWQLTALRLPKGGASPAPERFLVTYRSAAAIVRATGNKPALVIGGVIDAGMNSYLATSAVEAIDPNGYFRSLPSLSEARSRAAAYRFGDGVLVIGGRGEDGNATQRGENRLLSMEWLASDAPQSNARWVDAMGTRAGHSSTIHQSPDGSLLAFDGNSRISRITLKPGSNGLPSIEIDREAYPPLNRARMSYEESSIFGSPVIQIRQQADGRVVVAGGQVQSEKIALLAEDSDQPDATDKYIGIGAYLPSRRHEIYEPATRRWHDSVPSRGAGGNVAILPDGRVLKIGQHPGKNEGEKTYMMEISNTAGTAWSTLPADAQPKIRMDDSTIPFVANDELFLAGQLGEISTGGGPSGVEWFNAATGKWEILWHASHGDNWRDHNGRLIVRQLANGKRVVLPVNGY